MTVPPPFRLRLTPYNRYSIAAVMARLEDAVPQGAGEVGLVREVEFLEPLNMAILSERRVFAPYGLEGGQPGQRGENLFIHKDGRQLYLGAKNEILAQPGDRFRILTPGGGGFGERGTDS